MLPTCKRQNAINGMCIERGSLIKNLAESLKGFTTKTRRTRRPLVPKLLLGNSVLEALASCFHEDATVWSNRGRHIPVGHAGGTISRMGKTVESRREQRNRPSRDLDLPGCKNLEGLHPNRYLGIK